MGMCRMVGVEGVRSYMDDCLNSGKIKEIYVNENLGIHHDKVKLYRYDEDVAIPNLSKLLPINRDLKPGLIIKWDKSGFHPLEVVITLEYKTGDATNHPYAEYPVDKEFSRIFRKHGWRVEGKGTMVMATSAGDAVN